MIDKLSDLTKQLHSIMSLAEECQNVVRDLEELPRNFEHTLTRINILQVKIETIRQTCHAAELINLQLGKSVPEAPEKPKLELRAGEPEPEPRAPDSEQPMDQVSGQFPG